LSPEGRGRGGGDPAGLRALCLPCFERHRRLEEAEHGRDTQPKTTRDTGESYPDRSAEVRESNREADEDDGEHKL
jgi:hypothetical protein